MRRILLVLVVSLFCFGSTLSFAWEQAPLVRMAHIEVKPGMRDAFLSAVTEAMRTSVRTEAGVLALYCVADPDAPNKLTFFELYASEDAYQSHRATSHFKQYIERTKDLSLSKVVGSAIPVELQDKWHLGK